LNRIDGILRLGGVLTICLCLVIFEPGGTSLWHRLLVPLLLALGAWLLVQNLAAVAFGTTVLAVIHSSPGAQDPIEGLAYPAIAALGCAVLAWIFGKRFRARIEATRSARRARRQKAPGDAAEP
jgi:hypothetical protein